MSKKIICLLLSLIMLLGVLAACGEKEDSEAMDDITDEASQSAVTLAMYLMSEKPVDSETVAQIENAVNKITENKFKTRLKLYYFTEEEYYAKLDKAFAERAQHKADGTLVSSKQEAESGEAETVVDEYGIVRIKYPTLTGYQVDIFYMGGKDKFDKYKTEGMLTRLDDEINSSSKDLTTNIPAQYLSNIKSLNKGTYAVPTSKPIGDYTYLMLNKEAMVTAWRSSEAGSTTYDEYTSLTCEDVKDFLDFVASSEDLAPDYYPLYTPYSSSELLINNMNNLKYWGVDSEGVLADAFSVLGGYYGNGDDYLEADEYAKLENLFANEQFINDLKTIKYYEAKGYYTPADTENKKFAVGYMTCDRAEAAKYSEEYELIPVGLPRLSEEEIYSDMYAVCSYTSNVGRSMQIVTLLNTDVTFRNLILYGIEGEHYQLVDTGDLNQYGEKIMAVERFEVGEKKYMMDVNKTGNTFIAYPLIDEATNAKAEGILQNQEAKVDLTLGFTLDGLGFNVDMEKLEAVRKLSAEVLESYKNFTPNEGESTEAFMNRVDKFVKNMGAQVNENADVKALVACQLGETAHEKDGTVKDSEDRCHSLYCCYVAWLQENKIIK